MAERAYSRRKLGAIAMHTRVDEIAERIYRLSTCVPDAAPGGFTFNQFLIDADEPPLFHTGPRRMFPLVSQAIAGIVPLARLRWITFGHVESDECGAMNEFLAVAPHAQVAHGMTGCMVSLDDLCDRPPRRLADGEAIDLGGKQRGRGKLTLQSGIHSGPFVCGPLCLRGRRVRRNHRLADERLRQNLWDTGKVAEKGEMHVGRVRSDSRPDWCDEPAPWLAATTGKHSCRRIGCRILDWMEDC